MKKHLLRSAASFALLFSFYIGGIGQIPAFDTSRMDKSVSACEDFYQYVNGTWMRTTEIPPAQTRWGTFNILAERNNEILREILDEASSARHRAGSDMQLIGDFYYSCMDEEAIERAGTTPLAPIFRQINTMRTANDVRRVLGVMHSSGFPAVFSFGVGADLKDSNKVIVNASQAGLTLPNRDFYTNTDARSIETRQKFVEHMANMFVLLGEDTETARANANTVMLIQTALANVSQTPVELRNPDNRYNMVSLAEAQQMTPGFNWATYMRARGITPERTFNLPGEAFFKEMDAMLSEVPARDWQVYFRWMALNSAASVLPKVFRDENFEFFGRYLAGQREQQPRWRICVQATNSHLGEALGMEYARREFKPEARARMNEMIDNLMAAMKVRIENLDWMGPETKKEALYKLSTFERKIGYPDNPRGYRGLTVDRRSYAGNVMRSGQFQIRRNFADLGKPRDRSRWFFTPSIVNASYSSVNNDISFPAGILQPPFFNFNADDAINYGAIGGVIGHEITHGFDDQGSRFDAEGNLKMWWTDEDRKRFEERADCVVKQWDGYEVQPGLFMVGKLALGENIGDFAGLTVAYDAYKMALEGKPTPPDIDGFTHEQRFFLGWGQVWASLMTPEAERLQVRTGPHSLPRWRVNGPLSNMPQFQKAFGCKEGQPMVRANRCSIW